MTFTVLEHGGPKAFAHRGGASEAPENTLPAFEYAVGLGYRYLETDVHLTADGVLMAFHDDRLDRTTDRVGVLAEMTYREVAAARVDGREPIPRFEELLAAFPGARFNIDPKSDAAVEPLAALLRRSNAIDRVLVAAFSDDRIRRMVALCGPSLCAAAGPRAIARFVARVKAGIGAGRVAPPVFQVPLEHKGIRILTPRFVEYAHAAGSEVHVWTVDDPPTMNELLDLGVDGIMTDRPAVLKEVLVARGQWV